MVYECIGSGCPNFQAGVEKIVSETIAGDGTPYFDIDKDAERLAPVAKGVCTSNGVALARFVTLTETDCGFDINRRFEADPMTFIGEPK